MPGLSSRLLPVLALTFVLASPAALAQDGEDLHAGYYYPETITQEYYPPRAEAILQATPRLRIGFVTGVASQSLEKPYAPRMAMFAKGEAFEKLIIVALDDGPLDTIHRARAVLANLTASARLLPIFEDMGVDDRLTFFDLIHMMGFEQLTISDGKTYAHQVVFEDPAAQ